jgi:hypothetical protein
MEVQSAIMKKKRKKKRGTFFNFQNAEMNLGFLSMC